MRGALGGPPPTDIPATALWLAIQESPLPSEVVDFPRKNAKGEPIGQIRISVLSGETVEKARLKVLTWMTHTLKISPADQQTELSKEVQGDALARELLSRACTTAEPVQLGNMEPVHPFVFPVPDALKKLTEDELAMLWAIYLGVQNKYGPLETSLTEHDTELWTQRLAEGGSAYPLALLDSHQLGELTLSLAKKVSCLCSILERHSETLPTALASELATSSIDTSLFGEQLAEYGSGLESTPKTESLSTDPDDMKAPVMTLADAADHVRTMRKVPL